jgi:hypothetical protein
VYRANKRATDPLYTARVREQQQRQNQKHGRRYWLKYKFGITVEQWDQSLSGQDGCCYLCGDPLDKLHIHIDHDHRCCPGNRSCGQCIRGLACRWCNQGLGQFKDDPARLRRVADNLEKAMTIVQLATRA